MMETPEKKKNNQITTSIENLQRSPVFDFLDNLSPIKPVKSSHFRGSINPLSFASLPPVFASPQENPLKVLKFTQRFHVTDQAKPEFASYDNDTNSYAPKNFEQDKENLDPLSSGPAFDVSKILVSPEKIDHDSNNPNPQKGFYRNVEANLEGSSRTDESRWEDYISDETDLFALIESACEEQVDPATTYYKNIKNAMKNMMSHGSMVSGEQALKRIENAEENLNIASGSSISNPIIEKVGCGQHSVLSNDLSRHGFIHPSSNSTMLINSDNINLSKQQQSVSRNDSPHLILSEFGLQLNPLSRTLVEYANERSTSFDQKSINTEKDQDFPKADRPRSNKHMRRQENNTISPKKKRRKSESCKRCNCKKSKCLKLYCECFAAGVYCVEPCACVDCFNKPTHAETVITTRKQIEARNPLAFAPKVIKGDDSYFQSDIGENSSSTPASARHKRGCNCKKSGCLKKYCECYQSGVGCSINCRCENCKNAFGRKDSFAVAMEAELDEEEEDGDEEDGDRWKLRNNRFSTKQKPPRCSFPDIPHSSSLQHIPKFGRSFEDDSDKDEIPEILRFRQCPKPNKVLSPNGKRVSPPQTRQHLKMSSSSPGLRSSSRRLILTSIPSFPSLASYNQ